MPSGCSGWNTDYSTDALAGSVSTAVRGVEILVRHMLRLRTLLGPEGSVALATTLCGTTPAERHPVTGVRGEIESNSRPYFENYTVDASIFVVKLLRAHGGCLGTRSRRRT